mgnify:CR=1 FL=1
MSHDRDFLDRTVTEVLAFEGAAQIDSYIGGYSDYLEAKDAKSKTKNKKQKSSTPALAPLAETIPDANARENPKAPALSFTELHELKKLPATIAALEKEIEPLRLLMADPELYTRDPQLFDRSLRYFTRAQKKLEDAENRWLELESKTASA